MDQLLSTKANGQTPKIRVKRLYAEMASYLRTFLSVDHFLAVKLIMSRSLVLLSFIDFNLLFNTFLLFIQVNAAQNVINHGQTFVIALTKKTMFVILHASLDTSETK